MIVYNETLLKLCSTNDLVSANSNLFWFNFSCAPLSLWPDGGSVLQIRFIHVYFSSQ